MNYTPLEWLQIGLANAMGEDKRSFDERLAWVTQPQRQLDLQQAEEPAYALALWDGLTGNPRVRVQLDATASGTQILAAFANCKQSGTHCNLFGTARRDTYTHAWQAMGAPPTITRKLAKEAFMTASFGSTKIPRETLGEENLPAFYAMYQREFPGVWGVLRYLENLWQPDQASHRWTLPDGFEVIQWNTIQQEETVTLFGQTQTVHKLVHAPKSRGIALMANVTHSTDGFLCREMVKRAQFNPRLAASLMEDGFPDRTPHPDLPHLLDLYRRTQFLSLDLVTLLDRASFTTLRQTEQLEIILLLEHLASKDAFFLLPVHDSFSCEPQYCNATCDMYRYLMQQLWDSTLLSSIAAEITGTWDTHTKYPAILDGVHMLC